MIANILPHTYPITAKIKANFLSPSLPWFLKPGIIRFSGYAIMGNMVKKNKEYTYHKLLSNSKWKL